MNKLIMVLMVSPDHEGANNEFDAMAARLQAMHARGRCAVEYFLKMRHDGNPERPINQCHERLRQIKI